MSRIEIGGKALYVLPEIVSSSPAEAHGDLAAPRVALVIDATPMRRDGGDLKEEAERLLGGLEVQRRHRGRRDRVARRRGGPRRGRSRRRRGRLRVVVGSGTVTDVCKEATGGPADRHLVVVQTAASVNAFSDDMAVLLKSGTKRTVPSRWPDALLVDLKASQGRLPR